MYNLCVFEPFKTSTLPAGLKILKRTWLQLWYVVSTIPEACTHNFGFLSIFYAPEFTTSLFETCVLFLSFELNETWFIKMIKYIISSTKNGHNFFCLSLDLCLILYGVCQKALEIHVRHVCCDNVLCGAWLMMTVLIYHSQSKWMREYFDELEPKLEHFGEFQHIAEPKIENLAFWPNDSTAKQFCQTIEIRSAGQKYTWNSRIR